MIDNPIGHKVHQLVPFGICSWKMDKDNIYEVVRVKGYDEVENDWCRHFIIKGENGEEKEIRECECVFCPDYTKKYIENTIQHFLDDNGVGCEVYTQMNRLVISVSIEWGDWSHSHRWCVNLMSYLGYREIGNEITEEDGSDCYSAIHHFIKIN